MRNVSLVWGQPVGKLRLGSGVSLDLGTARLANPLLGVYKVVRFYASRLVVCRGFSTLQKWSLTSLLSVVIPTIHSTYNKERLIKLSIFCNRRRIA
jgi:hypothetical protein